MFYFSHESCWFNSLCSSVVLNFGLTGSTTMFPIYSQVICDNNRLFTHFALISSSRSTGSCFLPELWLISRSTTLLYLLSICRLAAISLAPLFF